MSVSQLHAYWLEETCVLEIFKNCYSKLVLVTMAIAGEWTENY